MNFAIATLSRAATQFLEHSPKLVRSLLPARVKKAIRTPTFSKGMSTRSIETVDTFSLLRITRDSLNGLASMRLNLQALSQLHRRSLFESRMRGRTYIPKPISSSERRYFCSERADNMTKTCVKPPPSPWWKGDEARFWGTLIHNILTGLGSIGIGVGTGKYWITRDIEIDTQKKQVKMELALMKAKSLASRTLSVQEQVYKSANKRLIIMGVTGFRIIGGGGENPVRNTIIELLKKGVEVNILFYDPNMKQELGLTDDDISLINQTIELAKVLKAEFPDKFKAKMNNQRLLFHGDLIDDKEAQIVKIPKEGFHNPENMRVETYHSSSSLDRETFNKIKANFEKLFREAADF